MTSRAHYETLVASLPHLPRFERAERLPINRERLQARLRMLSEEDAAELARAVRLLEWAPLPPAPSAAAFEREWAELREGTQEPALRALLDFHADVRTVLAALRRRRQGLPAPGNPAPSPVPLGPPGPTARWMRHVAQHWEDPDFKLGPIFPWIGEARAHLTAGDAPALERLLIALEWRLLERLAEPRPFSFAAVLAYRFQWRLLQRWLAYDEARGHARFEHLIAEVRGEQPTGRA
jgi:Protein of unknown function (DUF2764)